MRALKGTGMTDEQVVKFVNGCEHREHSVCDPSLRVWTDRDTDYPAYELYTELLRQGIFGGEEGKQLLLVIGRDRKVVNVRVI